MKNIYTIITTLLLTAILFSSCEDVIEVDTGFATPQIVIDAWVDNRSQVQTIMISQTQDYFDNSVPTGITDAVVTIQNGTDLFTFDHSEAGRYVWTPAEDQRLGNLGDDLDLKVVVGEQQYSASTSIYRVPVIDSIGLTYEEESPVFQEGLYGEAYARDFPGVGDCYWMKSIKNDTLLNKPAELNIIYDGTFDPGSNIDGITFIVPKRRAITPLDDDGSFIPYVAGDKIDVELHSISREAFNFLLTVFEQTTNGDNTIFAIPLANSKGNIIDDSTGERILGVFNVAKIETKTRIVE